MKEDRVITPTNQVRLTNVSVVRMNRFGKRFEVACYKNKIVNYRQGIETDLSEVLQTTRIFSNVSKGEFAPTSSLKEAFGTTDENEICSLILTKGQIQVSNLERSAKLENKALEIATMISEKCVNTYSQRRFTTQAIKDAMKEAEYCVHSRKEVKQQFLDCFKLMKEKGVLPIERAKMRLSIVSTQPGDDVDFSKIVDELNQLEGVKDINISSSDSKVTFLTDPSLYRIINKIIGGNEEHNISKWRLEILQQCVFQEGEVNLENEIERKGQLLAMQQQQKVRQQNIIPNISNTDVNYIDQVSQKMQKMHVKDAIKTINENNENNLSDDDLIHKVALNNRKKLKKAKKKNKKAKRREMEDLVERQDRQRIEKERELKINLKKKEYSDKKKSTIDPISAGVSKCVSELLPTSTLTSDTGSNDVRKSCNTCGGSFTMNEYRAHFRSDWHRHNLKLKMKDRPVLTLEEFNVRDEEIYVDH